MKKKKFPKVRTRQEETEYDKWLRKNGGFSSADTYIVSYWATNEHGFAERMEVEYFASGKQAHNLVCKRFAKDYPSATIIRIVYV